MQPYRGGLTGAGSARRAGKLPAISHGSAYEDRARPTWRGRHRVQEREEHTLVRGRLIAGAPRGGARAAPGQARRCTSCAECAMGGSTVTPTSASLYIMKPSTPVSTWRACPTRAAHNSPRVRLIPCGDTLVFSSRGTVTPRRTTHRRECMPVTACPRGCMSFCSTGSAAAGGPACSSRTLPPQLFTAHALRA